MKSTNEIDFGADVLKSPIPVVVKFEANWCAPCKAMKPVLDIVAAEKEGAIAFVTANVDEVPTLARTYRIAQIPALVAFHQGEILGVRTGPAMKSQILKWIDDVTAEI